MKTWNVTYKEHQIRVENGWFRGERLFIDGELQDQRTGLAFRSQLSGKIRTDDGTSEALLKVSLGGWFFINCQIFADDKLIFSGS